MNLINFVPISLMVAVLAFIWTYLANQFSLLSWVAFITWGAYFLTGVNTKGAIRETISFVLGIVAGYVIVMVGTALTPSLGVLAFPVTVALAAFIIVMLELVPWFDMAPGYFLGAAAFFAAGAKTDVTTVMSVLIPGILGIGFGILTGVLRKMIVKAEGKSE